MSDKVNLRVDNLLVTSPATFQAGTAALPAITTSGDTNTGLFFPAADTIAFSEGGAEAMRITSAGDVGIGTTSPDANLTVNGAASFAAGTASLPSIARSGDLNTGMFFPAADTIAFAEGGEEAMRIDSSGNVGIGTSSPSHKLHVVGDLLTTGSLGIRTGGITYTASTSPTSILRLSNTGHYAAEITVVFRDSSSPNGTFLQKLYIATMGSGTNVTEVTLVVEDKVRQGSGAFTNYFTWTANIVSNRVELSVEASATSGVGTFRIFSLGTDFTSLI